MNPTYQPSEVESAAQVVATDTQKNTVYAFAQEFGVGAPEDFLLRLGRHFVDGFEWVDGGRFEAELCRGAGAGDHRSD